SPASDERTLHFGIREISYELSLFGRHGRLRRVLLDPTVGHLHSTGPLIDVRHRAINRTPNGWAASLTRAGEHSPAVRPVGDTSLAPYLVIRVNGVRIAARGGSWGTDDAMKRISQRRLAPYFRLTRQAGLNIIRNWLGQDTEPSFYRLADRYGLLVLNDFWESTQNFQLQAENPQLFLANARDVIERYRNHPSIAVWFGRNEGVPQPILNDGLARLVHTLDGTRLYLPSSNRVNLQGSGPYDYRPPRQYFTRLARGFSVEVGTPSLASLRSLEAMMPKADLWPLSDTYAYHDWNFGGNGDVRVFMRAMDRQLGTPRSLEGFERRAQLMDYVSYRAIFEGFNAGLWHTNSGRLLWMTQPAWPSNIWQIYTSDYATAGAYYGVKEACEPLHVQMNLPDFSLAVVNTTRRAQPGLMVRVRIVSLDGHVLQRLQVAVNATANAVTTLRRLPLGHWLRRHRLVFVQLRLVNGAGRVLSRNVYWQARHAGNLKALDRLHAQPIAVSAQRAAASASSGERRLTVTLTNRGTEPAVALQVTALDAHGHRVLPTYYSANFVTLLPGAHRRIRIRCPRAGARCARVQLQGWNAIGTSVPIGGAR
ncbi:MAG: glycoside hydrolase family 2 TIM barrel-domain containing protein, partial [Steroidobacteraceae bacterium]